MADVRGLTHMDGARNAAVAIPTHSTIRACAAALPVAAPCIRATMHVRLVTATLTSTRPSWRRRRPAAPPSVQRGRTLCPSTVRGSVAVCICLHCGNLASWSSCCDDVMTQHSDCAAGTGPLQELLLGYDSTRLLDGGAPPAAEQPRDHVCACCGRRFVRADARDKHAVSCRPVVRERGARR